VFVHNFFALLDMILWNIGQKCATIGYK